MEFNLVLRSAAEPFVDHSACGCLSMPDPQMEDERAQTLPQCVKAFRLLDVLPVQKNLRELPDAIGLVVHRAAEKTDELNQNARIRFASRKPFRQRPEKLSITVP